MTMSYEKIYNFIGKAKAQAELGEVRFALNAIRSALETLVKTLCSKSGIAFDTRELTTELMINLLYSSSVITDKEKDLMHKVRIESNKGEHIELDNINLPVDIAYDAIDYMEQLMQLITNKECEDSMALARENKSEETASYLKAVIIIIIIVIVGISLVSLDKGENFFEVLFETIKNLLLYALIFVLEICFPIYFIYNLIKKRRG